MSTGDAPGSSGPKLTLPHGDRVAVELTSAIHAGDLDALRRIVADRPELASAHMIGRQGLAGGWRTPLQAATDWPGYYFPAAPAAIAILLEAGADPNDDTGGDRPETPLHWAASTDDADVAVVLIDNGADLETPGGSIGTPLDNAIGYACWHVARLLVARGASVNKLWHAAALGMLERIEQLVGERPEASGEVSQAFWHACAGGQRRAVTGRFNRVPTIMGTLRDENLIGSPTTAAAVRQDVRSQYGAFAPLVLSTYPLDRYDSPYIDFRTIVADSDTVCPALRATTNISKWTSVYSYDIADADPPGVTGPPTLPSGAAHGGEVPLLFPQLMFGGAPAPPLDVNQQALSDQMTAEWTAFARTGNPTAAGTPVWPTFSSGGGTVMLLQAAGDSQTTTAAQLAAEHHCALWDSLASQGA